MVCVVAGRPPFGVCATRRMVDNSSDGRGHVPMWSGALCFSGCRLGAPLIPGSPVGDRSQCALPVSSEGG